MFCDNESFGNDVTESLAVAENDDLIALLHPINVCERSFGACAVTTDDDVALGAQLGTSW
jgi:hypothetical protein